MLNTSEGSLLGAMLGSIACNLLIVSTVLLLLAFLCCGIKRIFKELIFSKKSSAETMDEYALSNTSVYIQQQDDLNQMDYIIRAKYNNLVSQIKRKRNRTIISTLMVIRNAYIKMQDLWDRCDNNPSDTLIEQTKSMYKKMSGVMLSAANDIEKNILEELLLESKIISASVPQMHEYIINDEKLESKIGEGKSDVYTKAFEILADNLRYKQKTDLYNPVHKYNAVPLNHCNTVPRSNT